LFSAWWREFVFFVYKNKYNAVTRLGSWGSMTSNQEAPMQRWTCGMRTLCLLALAVPAAADGPPAPTVAAVPATLRDALKLDAFYQKHADADGLPVLASAKVADAAVREAASILRHMLADRADLRQALVKAGVRVVVMAPTEMTTDVPEQRGMTPKDYWDKRARGLGGRITSCGEENLLNLPSDRYPRENILVHEFAHAIHNYGLKAVDPRFDARLREAYGKAIARGLWKDTYAATNAGEYWAEAVQSYFDCNAPPGGVHNDVNTRAKLAKYDPELFELVDDVFKQSKWRYERYDARKR
jgi:alpha-glucosidase